LQKQIKTIIFSLRTARALVCSAHVHYLGGTRDLNVDSKLFIDFVCLVLKTARGQALVRDPEKSTALPPSA
jgi:hypothetical protein